MVPADPVHLLIGCPVGVCLEFESGGRSAALSSARGRALERRSLQPDFVIGVDVRHETLAGIFQRVEKPMVVSVKSVYPDPAKFHLIRPRPLDQVKRLLPFRLIATVDFGDLRLGTFFRILHPAFREVELKIYQCELIAPSETGKHSYLAVLNLARTTGPLALHADGGSSLFEKARFIDKQIRFAVIADRLAGISGNIV